MKVCFLLTHVPNPRMNKRIAVFKDIAETKVICTRRASQNIWEPSQDVEHIIFDIDLPSSSQILKRYLVSQDFQKKAIEKLEEFKPNVIYAEGLDTLIIADQYKKKYKTKIIFEVADLRESFIEKPKNLFKRIVVDAIQLKEKNAFQSVDYLVTTSPKFYDIHYKDLIAKEKALFIPNVPDLEAFKNYKKKQGGTFTVGFIGGIRYLKQMKMLVDAANIVGCNVLFAGAGGTFSDYEAITKYCGGMQNVIFTGRYDYKIEIASLYGRVDCVFSVYDADNPNVRIALPNKLYESVLCELPIIVAKGTYLSEIVDKYGIGVSVSCYDKNELVQVLGTLKTDIIYKERLVNNCRAYRNNVFEIKEKVDKLKAIIK